MRRFLITSFICVCFVLNALAQSKITIDENEFDTPYTLETNISATTVTIPSDCQLTIPNGKVLTVTGTLTSQDVNCLIIEEGGQLVYVGNNTVKATVNKHIDAFAGYKWYTISTPMVEPSIIHSALCPNDDSHYDLYQYIEPGQGWVESLSVDPEFDEQLGMGYLYANTVNDVYRFEGELNTQSNQSIIVTYTGDVELKGFNLIGNPYPHDIYMGRYNTSAGYRNCAIYHDKVLPYYYSINGSGSWISYEFTDAIKPCQGVLIKLTDNTDDGYLRIDNTDHNPDFYSQSTANRIFEPKLIMTVSGNSGKDKIIVHLSDGIGLDKIDHISENAPYMCVNYDNKDYAIVHVGSDCSTSDIIFRNNQTGFFTLNVEEGLSDFSYLHLIDNITGDDIDLLMEPSYKFAANGNEYESRFKLVFAPNSNDGIDNTIFAYISNNDIIISGVKEKATLQVYDITGRIISSDIISGTEGSVCRVSKPNVTGVYVLRLIESNNVNTQKIVVE